MENSSVIGLKGLFGVVLALALVVGTVGCGDTFDSDDSSSDDTISESSSFAARSRLHDNDAGCGDIQVESHIQAAEVRYQSYVENGEAGADQATLDELWDQYEQQAELANEMVERFCG